MYKYIKSNYGPQDLPASLQVNRIGKYIYKHLDGAYKLEKSENMNDIYVTLLYELKPEYGGEVNDVREMDININVTTYQNKIRVNTIRMDELEKTLGMDVYKPEELIDLHKAFDIIMWNIGKHLRKEYKNYRILF